ncbi:hypothetical protein FE257_005567 [Aspergillus nanangensis]|uniref:Uncharacterized protein n=1 Tax=Aspergillus nanangensis TaxID=2582783 RepID=A0AAD4CQA3_ASPNN|nr:hypothetical protein FE257_005567 [Aspergillus nanangensis]
MYLTRQDQVESKEKALEAYRKGRFHGSARILELQGCLRISLQYHVPVLIDAADWDRRIKIHDSPNKLLPELAMAPNQPPTEPSLHAHLVRSLQEHFSNERQPPDGLIYQRLRLYEGKLGPPPDKDAAAAWWAILRHNPKSKKYRYVAAFFKHDNLPQTFNALLLIPGLWASMYLGVLHTMLALHCDEAILFYLERIRSIWINQILGGEDTLASTVNAYTVRVMESRVPKVSEQD